MAETTEERSNRRIDEVLGDLLDGNAPRHKLTKREAEAFIGDFYLRSGGGPLLKNGYRKQDKLCIMQTVNVYHSVLSGVMPSGEGLHPDYSEVDEVDPVIETYLIHLNDSVNDADRQKLLAYVPKLLNTKVSEKTERRTKIARQLAGEFAWRYWRDQDEDYFDIVEYDGDYSTFSPKTKKEWMSEVAGVFEGGGQLAELVLIASNADQAFKVLDRLLRAR